MNRGYLFILFINYTNMWVAIKNVKLIENSNNNIFRLYFNDMIEILRRTSNNIIFICLILTYMQGKGARKVRKDFFLGYLA